jgi:iron-sulfur cluster assembly protein
MALLTVSEKAAGKIRQIAEKQGKPDGTLRISVVGGGCSGLSYQFGFADQIDAKDKVIEDHGVRIALDPRALLYIAGSELDYEQSLMKSGFKVVNPNASVTCSCGESFSV